MLEHAAIIVRRAPGTTGQESGEWIERVEENGESAEYVMHRCIACGEPKKGKRVIRLNAGDKHAWDAVQQRMDSELREFIAFVFGMFVLAMVIFGFIFLAPEMFQVNWLTLGTMTIGCAVVMFFTKRWSNHLKAACMAELSRILMNSGRLPKDGSADPDAYHILGKDE